MTGEDAELLLAELLCARLCHDLAGPIGAVATGAELLADDSGGEGLSRDALALLAASATAAATRLRFLRLALGSGTAAVAPRQLRQLCIDLLTHETGAGSNITLEWHDGLDQPWSAVPARLLLNLVLLARDCLPRGGAIRVEGRAEGPMLTVIAEGPQAVSGETAAALHASGPEGLTPRGAQGYLAARLAARANLAVRLVVETGRILLIVTPAST